MLSKRNPRVKPTKTRAFAFLLGTLIFLSVFTLSFSRKNAPEAPAPGVTTELYCNEGTGTTSSDASGNGHNGVLTNGPTWDEGKYGEGINFDGINDYINIADHTDFTLATTVSYTWSAWIKNDNFTEWSTVWSQTLNATNFFYFFAHTSNDPEAGPVTNGVSVCWFSGSNKLVIHSNDNVLTADQWSYIVVTYNASVAQNLRFTIYVNGADVTNRTDVVSTGTISSLDPSNIRIGSNQPFGEYLSGSVDEIRYYRRLLSVAEIESDMDFDSTPDTESPTVNITAPATGNVSGTINVNANAADNAAVAGVQFLLNGVNLGAEDITAPYSVSWNTIPLANGAYTLTARARDEAGNTATSAGVVVTVNNDTQIPTVNLTAPAAGIIAGTLNVMADAADNVGVTGVQFLLNGTNLGAEDLSAPYLFTWNTTTITDASYTLTARARDAAGNTKTSSGVIVRVSNLPDVEPPKVNITSPSTRNILGTVNVKAIASDNLEVAGVQFLLDGANLGAEDLTAPYSVSWNTITAANGNHILAARARDAAGNSATSAVVNVTLNNDLEMPTISITAPAAGMVSGVINVNANTSDNAGVAGVQFLLDGANFGAEDLIAPYSVSWNTTSAANSNHVLTARARDASGNSTTSSGVIVTVNNPPDTELPTVNITSPSTRNVLGTITVNANANDNFGVVGVQFLVDGNNLGAEDLTAPYSVSWNTVTTGNAIHILTAKARDAAGNIATSAIVNVTVNNDIQSPTVNIASPAAGTVYGIVNVNATASDNIGVAGVQFLLNGANLGDEDIAAPFSVSWNAALATVGSHILSARARDVAGNTATAANVTVVTVPPPVISGISVSSITPGSAIINWTTDFPTNSKINYGTSTAYGLFTLLDANFVSSHSQTLHGLAPGTLYHYQIISRDANGILAPSTDRTFTSANLSPSPGNLNGHTVLAFPAGKIIPWTPNPAEGYHTVMNLSWNYLLNGVPNDPATGKPAYYSRSLLDPSNQSVVNWPHNPAGLYAMLVESALKYYHYSGNANVMQLAVDVALWHLDHGMTLATDNWPSVPYASGDAGSLNYNGADAGNNNGQGDGNGYLEPDKIGELGNAWLHLYQFNGNTRFRDAAIQAGNVLSNKVRVGTVSQSPWPFRVNALTGAVREDYCSNIIAQIALLDGLIASGLGNTAAYQAARTTAWNWMMTYPMQNNVWAQYFEDVGTQLNYNSNLNQLNALMVARYLLEHPEFDPNWETHVRGLISWSENIFGQTSFGATAIKEQQVFAFVMGSHSARYASVNALLYEKTGDLVAKEKAYRSFNWATYMARSNGVVIDGPDVNTQWFTDGYGDYVRHFMTGLAAVPEWSPANQTHLLRSSSVVKNISYSTNNVNYTTSDGTAIEVLHVNFNPATVTADGVVLPQRSDLSQPGWTLDVATKTLKIYHTNATQISISSGAPPVTLMKMHNNYRSGLWDR